MVRIKYRKEPPSPEQKFDRGKGGATDALDFDDVLIALKHQKGRQALDNLEQQPRKKVTLPDANFIERFMGRKK